MNDVWIYVNGIRHNPGSLKSWPDLFTHLTHFTTHASAYPAEHHFFVIRNYRKLRELSELLADLVAEYWQRGFRVHFCTHSNGAVVVCRMLGLLLPCVNVSTFHAIAPAAWGDCDRNGLNQALRQDQLGHFFFYGSTSDLVVRFGRYTGWLLRPIGAGYGGMAFVGPRDVDPAIKHRVHPFWAGEPNPAWLEEWDAHYQCLPQAKYGHSTWFDDDRYRQTFARIQQQTKEVCPDYAESLHAAGIELADALQSLRRPASFTRNIPFSGQ